MPDVPPIAVMFDWDRTLAQRPLQAMAESLRQLRHRVDPPKHCGDEAQPASTVAGHTITQIKRHMDRPFRTVCRARAIDPLMPELLRALCARQIPVFIVSTGEQAVLEAEVERVLGGELAAKMHIYGEDTGRPRKPSPEVILAPLREQGIEPGPRVWMIGDSFDYDIRPALEAGVRPVLFGGDTQGRAAAVAHNAQTAPGAPERVYLAADMTALTSLFRRHGIDTQAACVTLHGRISGSAVSSPGAHR